MESLSASSFPSPSPLASFSARSSKAEADLLIVQRSLGAAPGNDRLSAGIDSLPKGLSLQAQEIVAKLDELLKAKLPKGLQSLDPEAVTPEATADRIVSQIASLFDAYAKQNPDLEAEELVASFMKLARQGVETGYGQAYDILDELGAFSFEGVKAGIEQTKILLDDKLGRLEQSLKERVGLAEARPADAAARSTEAGLLAQARGSLETVA